MGLRPAGTSRLLLLALAAAVCVHSVSASHFRYGQISWVFNSGTLKTDIRMDMAWRASAFSGGNIVGTNIQLARLLVDGSSFTTICTVTSVNAAEDWMRCTATYSLSLSLNAVHTARYSDCCRISSLIGGQNDQNELITAVIDLRGGNTASPVTVAPVIVPMYQNYANSVQLPVADADADTVTCRLATSAEMAVNQYPGVSVTSDCKLQATFGASPAVGSKFAVQVILSSTHGGYTSTTPVDFLVQIYNTVPPTCSFPAILPSNCQNGANGVECFVPSGSSLSLTITGTDPRTTPGLLTPHYAVAGSFAPVITPTAGTGYASPTDVTVSYVAPLNSPLASTAVLVSFDNSVGVSVSCGFTINVRDQCYGKTDGAACTDGNTCTDDACSAGSCVSTNVQDGTRCDDNNPLTSRDVCRTGVCQGTPGGNIYGDPHIDGFDGTHFMFTGWRDAWFNMLSHEKYQVNTYFQQLDFVKNSVKTYITDVGILIGSADRIEVKAADAGKLAVTVNGQALALSSQLALSSPSSSISYNPRGGHASGERVIIDTPDMTMEVEIRRYALRFDVTSISLNMGDMHGILGHTYPAMIRKMNDAFNKDDVIEDGAVEGEEADYFVTDGRFGTDFKFNRYDGKDLEKSDAANSGKTAVSSRKMMM